MKFITITLLKGGETDFQTVHININHIVTITDTWIMEDGQYVTYAKILLSNGTEIICDEDVDMIEKEYKELFKQYIK